MTLEGLFRLLAPDGGQSEDSEQSTTNPLAALLGGAGGGPDIGGLLGGLLGGDTREDETEAGIAGQMGLSPAVLQVGLALVLGRLRPGTARNTESTAADGLDLHALLAGVGQDEDVDANALTATGLPQQLSAVAGIDLADALKAIQSILALLTGRQVATTKRKRSTTSKSRAKSTRSSAAKSTTRKKTTTAKATAKTAKRSTTSRTAKDTETATKPKRTTTSRAKAKESGDDANKPKRKPSSTTRSRTRTSKKSLGETVALPADLVDILEKPAD